MGLLHFLLITLYIWVLLICLPFFLIDILYKVFISLPAMLQWTSKIVGNNPHHSESYLSVFQKNWYFQHLGTFFRCRLFCKIFTIKPNPSVLTKLFSCFQVAGLDFCPLYVINFLSLAFCILDQKAKLY